MKKIILVFSLVAFTSICQAQIDVPKTDPAGGTADIPIGFVKPPAIDDVGSTTNAIINMLHSKLLLPASQKPALNEGISRFLANKRNITSLADTNPADYLSKFNPLQKGLFGRLKSTMGTSTFSKFLALKPSGGNIPGNVLSHLFY